MGQLDQATQQNASASEELAATAEELSAQATQLQQAVAFFRLDEADPTAVSEPAISLSARGGARKPASKGRVSEAALNIQDFERF